MSSSLHGTWGSQLLRVGVGEELLLRDQSGAGTLEGECSGLLRGGT